jgi:hypothetical protein
MIEMRRAQLSFGDGLIAEEVSDLREDWMRYADQVLADEQIVAAVYEALAKRRPKSRSRGRRGIPAEVVLRLLVATVLWNARCVATSYIATLPAWAAARCRTPRPWGGGAQRSDPKCSGRSTIEW